MFPNILVLILAIVVCAIKSPAPKRPIFFKMYAFMCGPSKNIRSYKILQDPCKIGHDFEIILQDL